MNILTLSNCPLEESQGSGYIIVNTRRVLMEHGHAVDIFSPKELTILSSMGGRAVRYRTIIGMAKFVLNHSSKIKQEYDAIIFYGAESCLAIWILKTIMKYRGLIILHTNGIETHVNFWLEHYKKELGESKKPYQLNLEALYIYVYKKVDYIITLSKFDKDFVIAHHQIPATKVEYLEPCLSDVFLSGISDVPKQKIITYCGSWIARKGIYPIKEALPQILREHRDYKLRLIGVGQHFDTAGEFPADVTDQIEIVGFVTDKRQLAHLYCESEIFLFPSFHESFGLVIAEAMACKCAIVSSATGYGASLITEEEVLCLAPPIASEIYTSLSRLINDPLLIEKLAVNGYNKIQSLKWDNYGVHLNELLHSWWKVKQGDK